MAGSSPICPSRNSEYPEITISRLLKSWAMPPARRPTASIFWAWRSCCSRARRSVTSSAKSSKKMVLRSSRKARPGKAHADNGAVVAQPVGGQALEFLQQAQVIGQTKPLLGVGIEVRQIAADQVGAGTVAQHGDQRRIHVEQNAGSNRTGTRRREHA